MHHGRLRFSHQPIMFIKNTLRTFPGTCERGRAVANGAMPLHMYRTCYHHPPLTALFIPEESFFIDIFLKASSPLKLFLFSMLALARSQALIKEAGLKFSAEGTSRTAVHKLSIMAGADRTATNHQHDNSAAQNSHPHTLSSSGASMLASPFSINSIHGDYVLIKSPHFNHLCPVVGKRA